MTLPNDDVLAKVLAKADPAPWTIRTLENFGFNVVHYRNGDKFDILRVAKCAQDNNAMLIALAPDLAAEILALRKRVEAADETNAILAQTVGELLTRVDDAYAPTDGGHSMHVYGQTPDWFVEAAYQACFGMPTDDGLAAYRATGDA